MGAGHGDRLTSLDASFLHMETPNVHMHVGGLFLFDGRDVPDFDFGQFLRLVRSRLHLVPRYRQKLGYAPLNLHNPIWIDDSSFDLSFHVRHAALPVPGTMAQLMEYSARILSRQLDRNRPLWELYVIEGIEGNRFAILGKNHHAMIDGVAGIDIATVMLDMSPEPADDVPGPEPWTAAPAPADFEHAWDAVKDLVTAPRGIVDAGRRLAAAPGAAAAKALRVGRGVVGVLSSNLPRLAPHSPLNRAPGQHRRFAVQRVALERVKAVKNTYDTTVNDVVLAITADATGRFLRSRGTDTEGLWLKAMVPVSVRVDDQRAELGNKVASVFVPLPMFEMDAVERLRVCSEAMGEVKQNQHAVGADFLIGLTQFAPPTIHAAASRLAARARLFNLLVTNVPGPQIPIYCLGARLVGAFPFTPLAPNHTYAVGIVSIDGWLNFGFTADWDTLPDIENATGFLIDAMQELERSAEAADTHSQLARKRGPAEPPSELRKA